MAMGDEYQRYGHEVAERHRLLFWIERIGLFIMVVSWLLVDRQSGRGILSMDSFLNWSWYMRWLLRFTNFSYFFLGYLELLENGIPNQGYEGKIGGWFVNNLGFLLERLALLIWSYAIQRTHTNEGYMIMQYCFILIFPSLNIYFACFGYSKEFQPNLHHRQKLLGNQNQPAQAQNTNNVQGRRTERLLFWIERLGFFTIACLVLFINGGDVCRDVLKYCNPVANVLWICTNFSYLLVFMERLSMEKDLPTLSKQREMQGNEIHKLIADKIWHWLVNIVKNPGFWVERLTMLLLAHSAKLCIHQDPQASMIFDFCFMIALPLSNIYYACFGYSKEFQSDLLLDDHKKMNGENGSAKDKISSNEVCKQDESNQEQSNKISSLEVKKLLDENHERYMVESKDAWQTILKKLEEKNEEDCQRLKEQNHELAINLSAATASSQLYRSLLHDNISVIITKTSA